MGREKKNSSVYWGKAVFGETFQAEISANRSEEGGETRRFLLTDWNWTASKKVSHQSFYLFFFFRGRAPGLRGVEPELRCGWSVLMLLTLFRLLPRCCEIFKWSLGVSPHLWLGIKGWSGREELFMSAFYNPWINRHKIIRRFCAITLSPSCLVLGGVRRCPHVSSNALIQDWINHLTFSTAIISFRGEF